MWAAELRDVKRSNNGPRHPKLFGYTPLKPQRTRTSGNPTASRVAACANPTALPEPGDSSSLWFVRCSLIQGSPFDDQSSTLLVNILGINGYPGDAQTAPAGGEMGDRPFVVYHSHTAGVRMIRPRGGFSTERWPQTSIDGSTSRPIEP